jgi:hypothetical protein
MACDYESYLDRRKKNEVFAHYEYLKNKTCCDESTCELLAKDYELLQNRCSDTFRKMHLDNLDEKGIPRDTLCETIKNKKIAILDSIKNGRPSARNTRRQSVIRKSQKLRSQGGRKYKKRKSLRRNKRKL